MNLIELRNKAKNIQPSVRIGKYGINLAAIEEIKRQLKNKKLVKIKLLKNSGMDTKETAKELAVKTDSLLVDRVGRIIVLHKK